MAITCNITIITCGRVRLQGRVLCLHGGQAGAQVRALGQEVPDLVRGNGANLWENAMENAMENGH